MVDVNLIYKSNSEYLKAEDIGNQFWTVTIISEEVRKFPGQNGEESKLVLGFQETEKTMPLNITNARSIAEIHGHNSTAWVGKQIMLFTTPVKFQDKMVNAIRVRAPQEVGVPKPPKQTYAQATGASPQRPLEQGQRPFAPPLDDDEIPF